MFLENAPKVAFVMPCAEGVNPKAVQSALAIVANSCENGIRIKQIGITERTLIHCARNWLSKEFLATDCEWVFWMDSDMVLEARTITVMLKHAQAMNAKFLTGIYYQRMGQHRPVLGVNSATSIDGQSMKLDDEYSFVPVAVSENATVPFKVDMCGFGCVLLHRSVYDGMKYPYFRFLFMEDKPDSYISEDTYFCAKARGLGQEIWAIPELKCGHLGQPPIITAKDFVVDQNACSPISVKRGEYKESPKETLRV